MGNEQSRTLVWRQPTVADITRYASGVKDRYNKCPQTLPPGKLAAELSEKAMRKVQRRILAEYPYLSSVHESMVVCDKTQQDCPIVYVNDEFEKLTLYPKEEILGRNCRFLQGKHSNKEAVKKIRHAVDNGLPLDVELFNYRKDGTGFWNNFLMLPVHKSKGSKMVTHFIAIQKDITVVKKDTNAQQWTPPECAMWFEYLNMSQYSDIPVENDLDGKTLLTLNDEDLQNLGIDDEKDREQLVKYLHKLHQAPEAAYRVLETEDDPSGEYTGAVESVCLSAPQNQTIWRKEGEKNNKMAVKCYYKDEIVIFRGERIKYAQINKLIESTWHMPMKVKYLNNEEQKKTIRNAVDWKKVVKESQGNVRLCLSKRLRTIPETVTKVLDTLAIVIVLVDWDGTVLFANKAVKSVLEKDREALLHAPYTQLFPDLELSVSGEWKQMEALARKKKEVKVHLTISLYDEITYMIQAVRLHPD